MDNVLLDTLAHTVERTVEPFEAHKTEQVAENAGLPAPPANPVRRVQQVAGGILGAASLPVELMNTGFAVATEFIADAFPALPAATLTSLYVGPPHAHAHPPSLVPPAPPVPLPSLGPVVLGTSVQVLINGLPAARAGDIGTAPTCCGFYPMYEIMLGSSNVFIGGMRAARAGDLCKPCAPGTSGAIRGMAAAMVAAGQAVALTGVVADLIDAGQAGDPHMASALATSAAMGAAQTAADAVALAVMAAMGSDPGIPPAPGPLVMGSGNVSIGGFPMVNFPDPAMMLFGKLGRKGKNRRGKRQNRGCGAEGEPVDVVTGAVFDTFDDLVLPGPLPLRFSRTYSSARNRESGPLGPGFRHSFQRALYADLDGLCYVDADGDAHFLPPLTDDAPRVAQDGVALERVSSRHLLVSVFGEPDQVFEMGPMDTEGRLVALVSRQHRIDLRYNGAGQLEWIVGSLGQEVKLSYDASGRIADLRLMDRSSGRQQALARYAYDAAGRLVAWADAAGHQAAYAYDDAHRMTAKTDRRGYRFAYTYDAAGRCIHTHGADGAYDVRLTYQPLERTTTATSADGGSRQYFYDERGTITLIIDPHGAGWKRVVDDGGRLVEEVDPLDNVTSILYDADGGAIGKLDPLGRFLTLDGDPWFEDRSGGLDLPETPLGWSYGTLLREDAVARLDPDDPVLNRLPADVARLLSAEVPADAPRPAGPERDEAGRRLWNRDPDGTLTRRQYDAAGRLIQAATPDGARRLWQYDAEGNVLRYQDPDGAVQTFEYTSWNAAARERDALGRTTAYTYSERGEVTTVTDPGGTTSAYAYDEKDRPVAVYRDGALVEQVVYDLADNPVEKWDGDGNRLVSFEIGPGNLPVTRRLAGGETQAFAYDDRGRMTRLTTDAFTVDFAYTPQGQRTQDARDGRGVRHRYRGGDLAETTYFERFSVTVRAHEGETILRDPTGGEHRFTTGTGGLVAARLANGSTLVHRFDREGRCLDALARHANRTRRRTYRYTPGGDLLDVQDSAAGAWTYEYDKAHRLLAERLPDGTRRAYAHDVADNLVARPGLHGVRIGERNRLEQANGDRFVYDRRDRLARRESPTGTTAFTYDALDMLVRIDGPNGAWEAVYDPLGRRVVKRWGTHEVRFFWDGDRLAAEQDETGRLRLYVYAHADALVPFLFVDYDDPDDDPSTGRAYTLFTNQIGAPIEVTDAEGQIVWSARIDPYGTAQVDHGHDFYQPLRFPGHYHDAETGLHYNRYRYYSPELGRYLQPDPLDTEGGLNLYAYAPDPLVAVDLVGLKCVKALWRDFKGSVSQTIGRIGRLFGIKKARRPDPNVPAEPIHPPFAPRLLHGQEHPMSCAMASTRMVLHSLGIDVPEARLRQRSQFYPGSWDPVNGTRGDNPIHLLRENGVYDGKLQRNMTVDDIQRATANGKPMIGYMENPGEEVGHAIVIDGVHTDSNGNRFVLVRDPWPPNQGTMMAVPEQDFVNGMRHNNQRFTGWGTTTDRDFVSPGEVPQPYQMPVDPNPPPPVPPMHMPEPAPVVPAPTPPSERPTQQMPAVEPPPSERPTQQMPAVEPPGSDFDDQPTGVFNRPPANETPADFDDQPTGVFNRPGTTEGETTLVGQPLMPTRRDTQVTPPPDFGEDEPTHVGPPPDFT